MKKIISVILAAVMLAGIIIVPTVAEDAAEVYFDTDFSSDSAAGQYLYVGNFKAENDVLVGYADAFALQTKGSWSSYDVTWQIAFAEDETVTADDRYFSFVYINPNMKHNGVAEDDYMISLVYDTVNCELWLSGGGGFDVNNDNILAGPAKCEMDTVGGGDICSFGISVTEGRIRAFFEDECVIDYVDENDTYYIGYTYEEVVPSIMLWWNAGNCAMVSDIIATAPEGQYPIPETAVSFSLETAPVKEGDAEITVELNVTLPENATGYELGSFGLLLGYDRSRMTMLDEGEFLVKGTCKFSEELTENPYKIIWVSIKPAEQFKAGTTTAARVKLALNSPAEANEEFNFTLNCIEETGVGTMLSKDNTYKERLYKLDEISLKGATAVAEKVPAVAFELVPAPVGVGDTTVTVDLTATLPENATGYELGSFGLLLDYDTDKLALADEPDWKIGGTTMTSESIGSIPYKMMWVSIDTADQFKAGKTVIATLTFDLHLPAEVDGEFAFSLAVDEDNGVCSMPSKDGTHPMIFYTADDVAVSGAAVKAEKRVNSGDANGDGGINLSDASLMLRHIAKWEGLEINTDAADVNLDGNVNLSDVSKLLRYIAKWDGVLLGVAD